MGRYLFVQQEKSCLGCTSEAIKCMMLILDMDIGCGFKVCCVMV